MRWRRGLGIARRIALVLAFVVVVHFASASLRPRSADALEADIQRRCLKLAPFVEREVGCSLSGAEVVVLPPTRIAAIALPRVRELLSRIENGPTGDALEADARAWASGLTDWGAAWIDTRGRIVVPEPVRPHEGSLEFIDRGTLGVRDGARDAVVHALVRAHQRRDLIRPAFFDSVRSRADLLARQAVLEGHAEYAADRVERNRRDSFRSWTRLDPWYPREPWVEHSLFLLARNDVLDPVRDGFSFVRFVVEELGYERAIARIYDQPPSLEQLSRPQEYFRPSERSTRGPVFEDLRRWLARERAVAEADVELHVIAGREVVSFTGVEAPGYQEGVRLFVAEGPNRIRVRVLVSKSSADAEVLYTAWTGAIERAHRDDVSRERATEIRHVREADRWSLNVIMGEEGNLRRVVTCDGPVVVDVLCSADSEFDRLAERLAARATKFVTDAQWRETWLEGGVSAWESADAGLRLGAVSRTKRVFLDEDWEVRWLGLRYESLDESTSDYGREAILISTLVDPHPSVVANGLRALLWVDVPAPLILQHLDHDEASVRRAAWRLVLTQYDWTDGPKHRSEALRRVLVALDDPDLVVRSRAAEALSRLQDADSAELARVIRRALSDEYRIVRELALSSISVDSPLAELVPDLIRQIDRDSIAVDALGRIGAAASTALPRLRELLSAAPDADARFDIATAILLISGDRKPLDDAIAEEPHAHARREELRRIADELLAR